MEKNESSINDVFKKQGLHLLGFFLDEETIGGYTYSDVKNYTLEKADQVKEYTMSKWEQFELSHPNWKEELKNNADHVWKGLLEEVKNSKDTLKDKIIDYYYENQKKETEEK